MKRILIVEDDALVKRSMEKALGRRYAVQGVASVTQALPLLTGAAFDAVLSDYGLGDGTGLDVLRELQAIAPNTRRVLVCGNRPSISDQDRKEGVVQAMLLKPCGFPELVEAIEG